MNKIIGQRKHKYHAIKTIIDDIKFDSKKEAKRYQELKLLKRAGKIQELELQPKFILQERFVYEGKTIRAITYVADFKYKIGGKTIVEDTKGFRTEVFNIKAKMFKKKYPQYKFIVG